MYWMTSMSKTKIETIINQVRAQISDKLEGEELVMILKMSLTVFVITLSLVLNGCNVITRLNVEVLIGIICSVQDSIPRILTIWKINNSFAKDAENISKKVKAKDKDKMIVWVNQDKEVEMRRVVADYSIDKYDS